MSRISSTYGKQANDRSVKSASKMYGGNYLTDSGKSLTLSGEQQLRGSQQLTKSGKSTKSSFADSIRTSTGALEQEYIKSLQQQVYLLELENNHLRSQAVKATELHPTMAAEAEKMLRELKALQAKVDALQLENFRKEGAAEVLHQKVNGLTQKLAQYEASHSEERERFDKDSAEARRERDMYQRDVGRLQMRLGELQEDFDHKLSDLKASETKVATLRGQLEAALDKLAAADSALTEERAQTARLEARVRVLEVELASTNTKGLERNIRELRDENLALKERLRREQSKAHEETLLRSKTFEETSALVKQNAALEQKVVELERQIEAERDKSHQWAGHASVESDELVRLREREKTLEYQVSSGVEEVAKLRLKVQQLTQQLNEASETKDAGTIDLTVARRRLEEAENSQASLSDQLSRLQRDKAELVAHVDSLQQELMKRESEKDGLARALDRAELRLNELQGEVTRLQQLQATRWSEVEKMADTLRSAAHSNSVLFDSY
ncbi:hypothetical protein BOX15_Mlig013940g2 [Macrostomum lignano]|uniref:Uncharacterized protein n=1 Tax=Macrostomum lignano TaxID=282301 RepID=A0A267EBS8_9PLAT|nr:hypothetical protein BOX15_Mlig013940g2 [Macrostomum lignano]